jgi:exodeoxyribonuclease V alpha subunit
VDQLYLLRFFKYEETIAAALRERAFGIEALPAAEAAALLAELFPPAAAALTGTLDWQRTAAALALLKRFVVISGGPGTGKTYTVARILAVLGALAPQKLRIGLAAPTGKAALRLQESIRDAKTTLPPSLAELIPDQARTLHRLLGFQSSRQGFRHHRAHPLHLDLLILDEASMIDVPLMAAMLDALPAACRVILLGDRDQLASVEAGNLFGDICGTGDRGWSTALTERLQPLTGATYVADRSPDAMADALVLLHTSHRFHETSGIRALSRAVNAGTPEALETVLDHAYPDLHLEEQRGPAPTAWLREQLERFFTPLFTSASALEALQELGRRRILCALREGPSGVDGINRLAETVFRRQGVLGPGAHCYPGMPLIILRNDYRLNLFNGDTGILWPDEQGSLHAWFPHEIDGIRPVALSRLPPWQTSYAITVHKSQGSEFGEVLLILPHEDVPLLNRELLYTGITRARERLTVYGRKELFLRAISRRVVRYSGLGRKLRQQGDG